MQSSLCKEYITEVDELLVFHWLRCLKGDLTQLRRKPNKGTPENDILAWREFNEDYLTRIGLSSDHQKFKTLKDRHTEAIFKYVSEPYESGMKDYYQNAVEELKDEMDFFLKQHERNQNPESVESSLVKLSNYHKRSINARNTTVLEFNLLSKG